MPVSAVSVSTNSNFIDSLDKKRVFLAVPLEPRTDAEKQLIHLYEELAARGLKGKWTSPNQTHFTLVFLGDRTEEEIDLIKRIVRRVCEFVSPFKLISRKIASFGQRPRLLFLDWREEPSDAFYRTAGLLKEQLAEKLELDLRVMTQATRPHTTLIRFRHPSDSAPLRILKPLPAKDKKVWYWPELPEPISEIQLTCRYFCLYQSTLTPAGAVHQELERFYCQPD